MKENEGRKGNGGRESVTLAGGFVFPFEGRWEGGKWMYRLSHVSHFTTYSIRKKKEIHTEG